MSQRTAVRRLALSGVLICSPLSAQDAGLVYPLPPESAVSVVQNIPFHTSGADTLRLDLYRPARMGESALPVLIIYNGFAATGIKERAQQVGWSRLAAARGMAVVGYDSRSGGEVADFDAVQAWLRANAARYRIDPAHLALLAWSGHVSRGLGVAMDPRRTDLRAAVFLYGAGDVDGLRLDLPVLFVRAGLDNPRLNRALDELIARGLEDNSPITVVNYGAGNHGFDAFNDNDYSRALIDQVLAFVKASTTPRIALAARADLNLARAAAALYAGNWTVAVAAWEELVTANPQNLDFNLRLGEALLGAERNDRALEVLQHTWQLSEGRRPRDIAYPAAIAAARLRNFSAAEPFLRALLQRGFTAETLKSDVNFATLRSDPGFQALVSRNRP
jgi:dienelactone hydrolase